jgi:hypothetical protein
MNITAVTTTIIVVTQTIAVTNLKTIAVTKTVGSTTTIEVTRTPAAVPVDITDNQGKEEGIYYRERLGLRFDIMPIQHFLSMP